MEAIDKWYGGFLCNFRLNMFAKWSRSDHTQILPFCFAVLISLDGSNQKIVSKLFVCYFSSTVLDAINWLIIINTN